MLDFAILLAIMLVAFGFSLWFMRVDWIPDVETPPQQLEPWQSVQGVGLAPLAALRAITDHSVELDTRLHSERIDGIRESIASEGQREPGLIIIDKCGRVAIGDGHHRMEALEQLGRICAPIRIELVPRITGHGRPIEVFVQSLIEYNALGELQGSDGSGTPG